MRVPLVRHGSLVVTAALVASGCASTRGSVSPSQIPDLRASVATDPDNADVRLRLAAALLAAGDCESATAEALFGMQSAPGEPLGPVVVGRCQELDGRPADAVATYRSFLERGPSPEAADVVQGHLLLAQRTLAEERAALALAAEADRGDPEPLSTAVLPFDAGSDEAFQALRLGIASLVYADLLSIERFPLVERLQLDALLGEMELGQQGALDPESAPRVGRLAGAGRMVQGSVAGERGGEAVLTAALLSADGTVLRLDPQEGRFQDLLRLEKDLVLSLLERMGYELSASERTRILQNGTQNLSAFLAYADGLLAEDRGDFGAAASGYAEAARLDPGFAEAGRRRRAAAAAQVALDTPAGSTPNLVEAVQLAVSQGFGLAAPGLDALVSSIADIASLQGEAATGAGTGDGEKSIQDLNQPPGNGGVTFPATILIRIPIG